MLSIFFTFCIISKLDNLNLDDSVPTKLLSVYIPTSHNLLKSVSMGNLHIQRINTVSDNERVVPVVSN